MTRMIIKKYEGKCIVSSKVYPNIFLYPYVFSLWLYQDMHGEVGLAITEEMFEALQKEKKRKEKDKPTWVT